MEDQKVNPRKNSLMWWIIGGAVLVVLIVVVLIFALAGRQEAQAPTYGNNSENSEASNTTSANTSATPAQSDGTVSWQWGGTVWQASGTPPACADPLPLVSPVDLTKVNAILYPGQTRGGNYKPHGGFLFKGTDNAMDVRAPMDATLVNGSRYIEQGEVQYLLFFVNSCGIAYRFDHLLTLSPAMQKLADTLPAAKVDDSRTSNFSEVVTVKQGDLIATAVGFKKNSNVSLDLGVYDLRAPNAASKDATFASVHSNFKEQTFYGTCWLNLLPTAQSSVVKALPGGDQSAGKTSDYCK